MNYEETVELQKNIKIKDEAEKICRDFKDNVRLNAKDYMGDGRFKIWSDSHNAVYVQTGKESFEFQCRFLHETYNIAVTYNGVFDAIKRESRGIGHLKSHISRYLEHL